VENFDGGSLLKPTNEKLLSRDFDPGEDKSPIENKMIEDPTFFKDLGYHRLFFFLK